MVLIKSFHKCISTFSLDRNRYRYPKGPRDWRNIKDAISFHRKKRENLLALATDYPDACTVMTHVGRLVLLNDPKFINEIFIGRADLVSNKIDGYLENQLRYKEGKHIRTGRNKFTSWDIRKEYRFSEYPG
jgi:hypothetical protein